MWQVNILPILKKARYFLAILAFLVLVIGVIFTKGPKTDNRGNQLSQSFARQEQLEKLNRDGDSDGLKDWEELIFRTDSKNPDTDGDGAKDGEEIAMNRDPLVKGPKDQMATSTEAANSPYLLPNNLTGQLAEKFGISVIAPRLAGSQRPLDMEAIGNQIADEIIPSATRQNYFTEKDITISKDDSPAALRAYDKATDDILTSSFSKLHKHPLGIFSEALQTDDLSKVVALDPYLTAYDELIKKNKILIAPSSAASVHLRYLNILATQREAIRKMRGARGDVLNAVVGAQEFVSTLQEINSIVQEFKKIIERLSS
ncbi:MAG: hypothetical protein AAB930_00335 [Patescibacteria group bacterium]